MRRFAVLPVVLLAASLAACQAKNEAMDSTTTKGNATDRSAVNGTSGTGQPPSISTDTTAAAQQLGTVAPSAASGGTVAVTGTEVVHAASTQTTSTISGPDKTTTMSVATPTDTTATVKTTTGTAVGKATKKP